MGDMAWERHGCFHAPSGLAYHHAWQGQGPPLLLLHGFTGHMDALPALTALLATRFRILGVDLPGHGCSLPVAHTRISFLQVLSDLAALLTSRAVGPVACVGYSMGGRIGLGLACRHSHVLRALSIIGASPGLDESGKRRIRRLWDRDLARFIQGTPAAVFARYWQQLPLFRDTEAAVSLARLTEAQRQGLGAALEILGTGQQPSFWPVLDRVNIPVQLIAGGRDAKYTRMARAMHAILPGSTLVCVAEAGHRVHVDAPAAVFASIREHMLEQQTRQGQP